MKTLLLTIASLAAGMTSAAPIPDELVGIWAPRSAEFRGDLLMKGEALYLDSDGVGGFVGGDGMVVIGARIVVSSYNPATHILVFDITEQGKVEGTGSLVYDPAARLLRGEPDSHEYPLHRAGPLGIHVRKSLGLEPKQLP